MTTDHISPAGSIAKDSPAGKYLHFARRRRRVDFNSYGARRGNDRVMTRGTFANIRIRNQLAPGTEGGVTRHLPDGDVMPIYDAAMKYKAEGVPLVVLAGAEYGTGSSRDWAAKGAFLLGVRAVLAASFERIHRSNLVGMGVLPLEFDLNTTWQSLGLTGEEIFDIPELNESLQPRQTIMVVATTQGRQEERVPDARPHRHAGRARLLPQRRHPAHRNPQTPQNLAALLAISPSAALFQRFGSPCRLKRDRFQRLNGLGCGSSGRCFCVLSVRVAKRCFRSRKRSPASRANAFTAATRSSCRAHSGPAVSVPVPPPPPVPFLTEASPEAMIRELHERRKSALLLVFEPSPEGSYDLADIPDAKLKCVATEDINLERFAELVGSFGKRFMIAQAGRRSRNLPLPPPPRRRRARWSANSAAPSRAPTIPTRSKAIGSG